MPNSTDPTPEKGWRPKFLQALTQTGNVSLSATVAGIDRTTAYLHRREDSEFAAAWELALEMGADELEAEARRRAMESSDTLMIFLLKAHRPEKYREKSQVEHSGQQKVIIEYSGGDPADAAAASSWPDPDLEVEGEV